MINNGAVSQTAHNQTPTTLHSTEAEYRALSDASREAVTRTQRYDDLQNRYKPSLAIHG